MSIRHEARQYFEDCGLSYQDINLRALKYLEIELNDQFNNVARRCILGNHYRYENGRQKPQYWVSVNPAKYFKGTYAEDGHLINAQLTGRGTYFTCREIITFQSDGYICFAADADNINIQPVVSAFRIWCDWLRAQKEVKK